MALANGLLFNGRNALNQQKAQRSGLGGPPTTTSTRKRFGAAGGRLLTGDDGTKPTRGVGGPVQ